MKAKGYPRREIQLSDVDAAELKRMVRKHTLERSISTRAQIILLCAEGLTDKQVADRLNVRQRTVGNWRKRFWSLAFPACRMHLVAVLRAA